MMFRDKLFIIVHISSYCFIMPARARYYKLSAKDWSKAVSSRFERILQGYETDPPERKLHASLIKQIVDYIGAVEKSSG